MDEERNVILNIDTWQIEQMVQQIVGAITAQNNINLTIPYIPPIDIAHSGRVLTQNTETKETVMRDERSSLEIARSVVETLLSAATEVDAKSMLHGDYTSQYAMTLESAYAHLRREIEKVANEI